MEKHNEKRSKMSVTTVHGLKSYNMKIVLLCLFTFVNKIKINMSVSCQLIWLFAIHFRSKTDKSLGPAAPGDRFI